jgi:hypothetical protein
MTKTLEQKKESHKNLQKENKIPRSLRIKCELTTSPSYTNHPVFLKLKTELQQEVSNFITRGSKIMTDWANENVKLLNYDRCSNILKKALIILDGLTSFHLDVIGTPQWPSVEDKYIPLFLFKAYFSSTYINANDIVTFLDTPSEDILLTGTKIFLNTQSNDNADKLLTLLNLSDIDLDNQTDYTFVSEVLLHFDQIMRLTTIHVWHKHKEITRNAAAAIKLNTKMKSFEVINATTATALAIAKATDTIDYNQTLSANANLRISNLEKFVQKQEQKSNTIINQIKSKNPQKNFQGSHPSESVASPKKMTLTKKIKNTNLKRNLVDLTTEDAENNGMEEITPPPPTSRKPQKLHKTKNSRTLSTRKSVKWKEGEIKGFHPNYPAAQMFSKNTTPNQSTWNNHGLHPPLFPTPPPPSFHTTQIQNPFGNFQTYLNSPNLSYTQQQPLHPNQTQTYFHAPNPFKYPTYTQTKTTRENPFPNLNQNFHQNN